MERRNTSLLRGSAQVSDQQQILDEVVRVLMLYAGGSGGTWIVESG
jgi:hypothetical protein